MSSCYLCPNETTEVNIYKLIEKKDKQDVTIPLCDDCIERDPVGFKSRYIIIRLFDNKRVDIYEDEHKCTGVVVCDKCLENPRDLIDF